MFHDPWRVLRPRVAVCVLACVRVGECRVVAHGRHSLGWPCAARCCSARLAGGGWWPCFLSSGCARRCCTAFTVVLVLLSLPARLSCSLVARSAGAALSTLSTVALLGGSFCWCCPLDPLDRRSLLSLACGHRCATAFGLTLVLCAPDRLLYPAISRRLYRPFLRHLLRS